MRCSVNQAAGVNKESLILFAEVEAQRDRGFP